MDKYNNQLIEAAEEMAESAMAMAAAMATLGAVTAMGTMTYTAAAR